MHAGADSDTPFASRCSRTESGGHGLSLMRPGQIELNEFELALLRQISRQLPALTPFLSRLRVLSREFTGVGGFTNFRCDDADPNASEQRVILDGAINMPGVPNGMGAVLLLAGGRPKCLETFTYGNDHWDGVFEGFSIVTEP
jgi:hypothetical protein